MRIEIYKDKVPTTPATEDIDYIIKFKVTDSGKSYYARKTPKDTGDLVKILVPSGKSSDIAAGVILAIKLFYEYAGQDPRPLINPGHLVFAGQWEILIPGMNPNEHVREYDVDASNQRSMTSPANLFILWTQGSDYTKPEVDKMKIVEDENIIAPPVAKTIPTDDPKINTSKGYIHDIYMIKNNTKFKIGEIRLFYSQDFEIVIE